MSGAELDLAGPAAPPRRNGELVFAAPWESRVFGVTLALHERGLFVWEEFRERLIREIAFEERRHAGGPGTFAYYACWLRALEDLLDSKALLPRDELARQLRELASQPPDHHRHDHDHDHDHEHDHGEEGA